MSSGHARGRIKDRPEDFAVEELPAYEPSGEGEHLFVRFTKTDRTTLEAVRALARALDSDPREAGFAGMKDKRGVTTQTVSIHPPRGTTAAALAARARGLTLDGVVVLDATPHGNKLKPGHLVGNRFSIAVRGVAADRLDEVTAGLGELARQGFPNAFGAQRFGMRGDNAERALAWLQGRERGPRDPRMQRLLWSSLQSAVFNAVLDARVADGTWATPLLGDLLKLRDSGGLFVCSDVQADRERAATGEVSPTGPIAGARMRSPEGVPAVQERRAMDQILGESFDLARTRALGEGSRRPLRIWVRELRWRVEREDGEQTAAPFELRSPENRREGPVGGKGTGTVWVEFVLPKGAYATTALATVLDIEQTRGEADDDALENVPPEN
jgi:tRNA pseudouridine13 synthase